MFGDCYTLLGVCSGDKCLVVVTHCVVQVCSEVSEEFDSSMCTVVTEFGFC